MQSWVVWPIVELSFSDLVNPFQSVRGDLRSVVRCSQWQASNGGRLVMLIPTHGLNQSEEMYC